MATIHGTHQHASSGRRYRFEAVYRPTGPNELHWSVVWIAEDGGTRQQREGIIANAELLVLPHRAVIDEVVQAINEC